MQYGGELDGIDRDEFETMLENLDGFSEVDASVSPDKARSAQKPGCSVYLSPIVRSLSFGECAMRSRGGRRSAP